jgi:hypothetical protein
MRESAAGEALRGDQEFPIALGPEDGAGLHAEDAPARQGGPPADGRRRRARAPPASRTTPPLAMAGPTSNCGLMSATAQAPGAQKARAAGSTTRRPMKLASQTTTCRAAARLRRKDIMWRALTRSMHGHARVVAQLPGQLAVADIHRVDLRGALGQQHVGEAAGGGAEVHADAALRRQAEMLQPVRQLHAAAGDPGMVLAASAPAARPRVRCCRRAC